MHLNGQGYGDLSWYQGNARLLLVLTKRNRTSHLPYPVYDIGVDDASVIPNKLPIRLVKLHNFQDNISAAHTNLRASLRTILLVRHRPREDSKEPIYLPLNHSFPPSIRFPEQVLRSLLNRPTVTEVSIVNAQLPWSGDPPIILTYRVQIQEDVLYATALFGLCTRSTNGETGSLWATFRGGESRWESTDCNHQCTVDHVLHWPGLTRRFVINLDADDKAMGDRDIAKWMFDMVFTESVHTGALVLTHIDHNLRILFQQSGYRDFIEEEDERIQQTQALADHDAYPQELSFASTHGKNVGVYVSNYTIGDTKDNKHH